MFLPSVCVESLSGFQREHETLEAVAHPHAGRRAPHQLDHLRRDYRHPAGYEQGSRSNLQWKAVHHR